VAAVLLAAGTDSLPEHIQGPAMHGLVVGSFTEPSLMHDNTLERTNLQCVDGVMKTMTKAKCQ
jgi:hypothetical protein